MKQNRSRKNPAQDNLPDAPRQSGTGQQDRKNRQEQRLLPMNRRGFGLNEVIGIAAGIIIAAVVVIPGLKNFAESLLGNLDTWWGNMATSLFP